MMNALLYAIIILYLLVQIWQLLCLLNYKVYQNDFFRKAIQNQSQINVTSENLPLISILVACRNEEKNIIHCLDSLVSLKYPKNKVQILIGNDQSTDKTAELVEAYIEKINHSNAPQNIQLIHIQDDESGLKAKARVMAQMDQYAVGEFLLITDADVTVNQYWALGLLSSLSEEMGVASGTTMVKSSGIGGIMQEIDWTYFMGMLNLISFSGIPATAVGNNMIVRKSAYWQTGGYGKIKFSITEDYKLYSEICKKGWKWNNVMNAEVLAFSEKIQGFIPLLHQRKRWLSGGKELPWYWWILFGIYGLFYFGLPFMLFNDCQVGLFFWSTKFILQTWQINRIYTILNQPKKNILNHLCYEIYMFFVTIGTAIFFILPTKTVWKERKY